MQCFHIHDINITGENLETEEKQEEETGKYVCAILVAGWLWLKAQLPHFQNGQANSIYLSIPYGSASALGRVCGMAGM